MDLLVYRRFAPLAFRLVVREARGFRRGRKGGKRRRPYVDPSSSGVCRKVLPASNEIPSGKSFRETSRALAPAAGSVRQCALKADGIRGIAVKESPNEPRKGKAHKGPPNADEGHGTAGSVDASRGWPIWMTPSFAGRRCKADRTDSEPIRRKAAGAGSVESQPPSHTTTRR